MFVPVHTAACTGTFSYPSAPVTDTSAESDAAAMGRRPFEKKFGVILL